MLKSFQHASSSQVPQLRRDALVFLAMLTLPATATTADELFDDQVAGILVTRCLECHKGNEPSGGLSFENRDTFLRGGESGATVVPRDVAASLLVQRIDDGEMPPPVKGVPQVLPKHELAILRKWVAAGAHWPKDRTLDLYEVTSDVRGGRDWWAFQPIQRPHVPDVQSSDSVRNEIDNFVQARLETAQLQPAPSADSRTLVRRMYYDVTGLPPEHAKLDEWSAKFDGASPAERAGQIGALVDHLLDSPHFGERWARYWLDLVRYAESSGYERDQPKTNAWKYRDWVVDAINQDLPYDQFILQQLAGDEFSDRSTASLIATGFLRLGTWNDEPNDPQDYQYERLEDMVHVTTSAFLGLTVKCARCHDHKFDPIPQHDYYRIASVFWPGPIQSRNSKLLGGPSPEELGANDILGWTDLLPNPQPLHLLKNGERNKPLHPAVPGPLSLVPALFAEFGPPPDGAGTSHRRRQLAEWIVHPANPLTARVCVNRIWQHHFGKALVRSPNNFGFKGEQPTHPQLLDWLASELIDGGWSLKHIHRLILASHTWQQSSNHPLRTEYAERDSGNRMWWRANRRRLDAEALRDSLLAVSGEIDLSRIGGEGFKPTISQEALEGLSRKGSAWVAAVPIEQRRRSLYIYVSRSLMPPMMNAFDQCDTTLPCGQRNVTISPPQALAMMNNAFVHERSEALAAKIESLSDSFDSRITSAWKLALGRAPSAAERQLAEQHLAVQRQHFEALNSNGRISDDASNPSTVPQPVLHLSADTAVMADDAGRVSEWKSRTGVQHARQLNQNLQPVLVPNSDSGQPAIHFDGQGQFLSLEEELLPNAICTMLAVVTDTAQRPGLREIISNWQRQENSVTSVFLGLSDTDAVRFSDNFAAVGKIRNRQQPFLLTARNSNADVRIWQNRVTIANRAQSLTGRKFGTEWVIGRQGNLDGEYWNGTIAELMVFDRALSDAELEVLWSRLITKYELPELPNPADERDESPEHRALASLCHVLLNSNEFLHVD